MIDVGALRHRVTIQRAATGTERDVDGAVIPVQSTSGAALETWVDVAHRRASIEPLQGREFFAAQRENAEISHLIRMRYDPTLSVRAKDRIVFGARVFDIQSVINVGERNVELHLLAKEAA